MMTRRRHAGVLVHLLVHGLAVDDVVEADLSALFGEDGEGVRIPLDQELSLLDVLAVLDLELGAVDDGVALALAALLVLDDERARAVHDHEVALLVLDRVDVVELHACRRSWPPAWSARCGGDAVPPMWKVRMVSWVPGSPMDWAAMTPTAMPISTSLPVARSRP